MARKTNSLFGKALKKSLLLEQVWLKSEELPEYKKFYVDNGIIERLNNNSNQLIVGRRGTGKTHLIGTFHEIVESESQHQNDLSVFISILEVRPQTPAMFLETDSKFTSKQVAKELYASFLRILFNKFLDCVTRRLSELNKNTPKDLFKPIWEQVNHQLTELLEEIESGTSYETERKSMTQIRKEHSGNAGAEVQAELSLKNINPSAKVGIGVSRRDSTSSSEVENIEVTAVFATDLTRVRNLIHEIIDCLHIDRLFILIDEWMELEKRTPSQIQPHFAQLLKTTFFNSATIAVKIASVWHETSLYNKDDLNRSEGIQSGHDITTAADLDTAFLNTEEEVYDFCKMLLFKRVSHVCKKISVLEIDGKIDDEFITELFDNKINFKMFISASHGIPRDLMNLFQTCSIKIHRDFEKDCINKDVISEISRKIYRTDKRKRIRPDSTAHKLLAEINSYMEKRHRRLFLVNSAESSCDALRKLVDEELVHQIPSAIVHRDVSDDFKAYHIDFGNYVDFIQAKSVPIDKLLDEVLIPNFPDDIINLVDEYIISMDKFSKDYIRCNDCAFSFSADHPVYVTAGICPNCASVKIKFTPTFPQ